MLKVQVMHTMEQARAGAKACRPLRKENLVFIG
jgi:hypothetical protein